MTPGEALRERLKSFEIYSTKVDDHVANELLYTAVETGLIEGISVHDAKVVVQIMALAAHLGDAVPQELRM